MDKIDDLPEPPPESNPFENAPPSGGYLAMGNDDDEIRKIRRRISPLGKVMIFVVLALCGGTGYYVWQTAQQEAAVAQATTDGRTELRRIMGQSIPRDQIIQQVRATYQRFKVSPEVRMSARRILAAAHDADSMPLFIEGLHSTGRERQQAALAVAEIGLPAGTAARDALYEALQHSDPLIDRPEVAWAEVVVQDPRAWDVVVSLLQEGKLQQVNNLDDPPHRIFDAALVARMAGTARLIQLASDSHVGVKRIAAVSLAEVASPEVFDALVSLSRDSDVDAAREAAIGLGRTGLDRAGQPILEFLNHHPDSRDAVLNSLQQNAGAPGLAVVARSATDVTTKSQATRLLRELHDPGAADAFVAILGSTSADATDEQQRGIRKNAIFGLAEIGDPRAAEGLMELASRPLVPGARVDPNVDQDARLALDTIRKIPGAPARAKATLLTMLADPHSDFMRTGIMEALAEADDPTIGDRMMPMMANPDMQEGAAVAVCRLHYLPGIARVRADMRRPPTLLMVNETVNDEPVFIRRRNAIRGIAWTRDAQYAPDIMHIIEDPQDRAALREEAGHTLSALADDATITEIANRALDTARTEDVRLYYLFALRGRSNAATSNRLIEAYLRPGQSGNLMSASALAAGFGGDQTTAAALLPLISSTDTNVQLTAASAAILCGDESTANALLDRLGTDHQLAELLANTFVTRSASGNNSGVQLEPDPLKPMTLSMFTDGRIYRRIDLASTLERGRGTNHHDFAMVWLKIRIRAGWEESPLGISPYEVRAQLRQAALGHDPYRSEMAFRMFRSLNDRGSLLWLRRQPGDVAEHARRVLVDMNTSPN